jgi:malate/lactate dehydrogenase
MLELSPNVYIVGCGNALCLFNDDRRHSKRNSSFLVDYNKNKAENGDMDLSHSTPFVSLIKIKDSANSDMVVIIAGRGQKQE